MKIDSVIFAKILRIGTMKNVNPPSVSQHRPVLSIFQSLLTRKPKTIEQLDAETRRFVVRGMTLGLIGVLLLFAYSVVYTEQPLFNEAPTDKAIFAVLTLLGGQALQILANYLSRSSSSSSMSTLNKCPPIATIKQEEKIIAAIDKPSILPKPSERPPL